MQKRPFVSVIAVVVLLGSALGLTVWNYQAAVPARPQAWFYDVGSGELFIADADQRPPIAAPSGHVNDDGTPGGVKAHVYACGSCDAQADRFIAYLATNTLEVKQALDAAALDTSLPEADPAIADPLIERTQLVSQVDTIEWVHGASARGQQIQSRRLQPCDSGALPSPCRP